MTEYSREQARTLVIKRTGIALDALSLAESKIVEAVTRYVILAKQQNKDPTRTLSQIKRIGLISAAEASVSRSKTTKGFEALNDAKLGEYAFEKIVIDHPLEFSSRAQWFSRKALGYHTHTQSPPIDSASPVWLNTVALIEWLRNRARKNNGVITPFTNQRAAVAIGMGELSRFGRPYGNIQSRIDFACYRLGLPPLGLTAEAPFRKAWFEEGRSWKFPVEKMQRAARQFRWEEHDFDNVLNVTASLPGQAHQSWRKALVANEESVRTWAYRIAAELRQRSGLDSPDIESWSANPTVDLAKLERKYINATPESKEVLSEYVERGPLGNLAKRATNYKCQVCAALGMKPIGFLKRDGTPYVEAHHVMPVSNKQIGSLAASNILVVCANHHREIHYGNVIVETNKDHFRLWLGERLIQIARLGFNRAASQPTTIATS